jgi:hypothetical protein
MTLAIRPENATHGAGRQGREPAAPVSGLDLLYHGGGSKTGSKRWKSAEKRERRAWRDLNKQHRKRDRQQRNLDELQQDLISLDEWLNHLETDNQTNLNPVCIVLRVDAGFSTGPNLTWLIEMGYAIRTKAHHGSTADCLRRRVPPDEKWTRVGRNAEALYMGVYDHNDCPYPLQAMLVRYHLPESMLHTALLYYDETAPPPLPEWFAQYNGLCWPKSTSVRKVNEMELEPR